MYSLNLLPPKVQEQFVFSDMVQRFIRSSIALLVFTVASFGISLFVWLTLSRHDTTIQQQLTVVQAAQRKNSATDISSTTTQVNNEIKALASSLTTSQNWSLASTRLLQLIPKGATVSQVVMDGTGVFTITGTTDTRQTFLNLDSALKTSTVLKNVNTTSTASKRTDVPFTYSGTVLPPI